MIKRRECALGCFRKCETTQAGIELDKTGKWVNGRECGELFGGDGYCLEFAPEEWCVFFKLCFKRSDLVRPSVSKVGAKRG